MPYVTLLRIKNNNTVMNLPNFLTFFRISLIPLLVLIYYSSVNYAQYIAAAIFILASFTDFLDGFLARKLAQETKVGAFLDPVADKLIVVVALILLVQRYSYNILTICAAIIICREIIISALREWMSEVGKRAKVAVSSIGKAKTFMQMLSIIILLSQKASLDSNIVLLGLSMLYVSVILTLWSMSLYLIAAWRELQK
jgi:CDP-diacylglycerol--glycerol-3-phosphate 3-phosphatidyltransferase